MAEERDEGKKVRRIFTPEQKFEILKDIERCRTMPIPSLRHHLLAGDFSRCVGEVDRRSTVGEGTA